MPEGWAWSRLSNICNIIGGVSYNKNDVAQTGIKILRGGNIQDGKIIECDDDIFIPVSYKNSTNSVYKNDIVLVASTGSSLLIGKTGFTKRTIENTQIGAFLRILRTTHFCNAEFINSIFLSGYYKNYIRNLAKGTNINNVKTEYLTNFLIPLPPSNEQNEIIIVLNSFLEKVEYLESNKTELQKTIAKTKSKILDLAIHGKLVPQDANDEPASVLLEKLRAEKEEKIAKGELKRDKNDSFIYKGSDNCYYEKFINGSELEAEIPFDIPENWMWCKIKNLTNNMKYGTSEKSQDTGKVPVLRMGNITREGKIDYSDLVYTSNEKDIKELKLKYNDILFNRTNSIEWVGKTAIFKENFPCICAGYIISFTPNYINPDFLNYVMNSSYQRDWCNEVKTDGVNQSNINSQKLADFYVPFPPIREQLRIVKSIENLFSKLDNICLNLI